MLPPQVSPPTFTWADVAPIAADAVAVPVRAGTDGPELAATGTEPPHGDLAGALAADDATGAAGQVTRLAGPRGSLVLLVGVGAATASDLRRAGAALGRATKDRTLLATTVPTVGDDDGLRAFVEGLVLGSFEFSLRSTGPTSRPVAQVVLTGQPPREEALATAVAVATAGWRARLLATVPSNLKSPQWLADQATEIGEAAGLGVEVLDEQQLESRGYGAICAVGRASATPPRLVTLSYRPSGRGVRKAPHLVLVGKGITFDSGGLSIKPGELMVNMKRDMTGAAVVLATMAALADVGCPIRVTGLLPIAENVIGGDALRPGDVITHYGGRTTEVTNTDAEGRLVMADALAHAVADLQPDLLVDVATLTGAMKVAMGLRLGGFFATDDALADHLARSAARAGEPLWRMPLAEVYEERLASKVADADNAPGSAQAITAALFLQHFTGGLPWAHLDLASVGDALEERDEWTKGPTGFGARALLYWLEQAEPLSGVV